MYVILKSHFSHLRSRLTMAYPTMIWSFSRDVSGRSRVSPSSTITSLSSFTVCRVGGFDTSVRSSDCQKRHEMAIRKVKKKEEDNII